MTSNRDVMIFDDAYPLRKNFKMHRSHFNATKFMADFNKKIKQTIDSEMIKKFGHIINNIVNGSKISNFNNKKITPGKMTRKLEYLMIINTSMWTIMICLIMIYYFG